MVRGYDRAGGARSYGSRASHYGKHAGHAYSGDNAGDRSGGYDDRRYALGPFSHAMVRHSSPATPHPVTQGGPAGGRGRGPARRRRQLQEGPQALREEGVLGAGRPGQHRGPPSSGLDWICLTEDLLNSVVFGVRRVTPNKFTKDKPTFGIHGMATGLTGTSLTGVSRGRQGGLQGSPPNYEAPLTRPHEGSSLKS